MGVVDLGATKTVIGSNLVKDLLEGLTPAARKSVRRCPCPITFRFGNQGTLKSEHALAIPIHGLWLKIAVVPVSTPFLLSNTLLRAIGAVIDTSKKTIYAAKIGKTIPIQLTGKGSFLLDLNDLVDTTVSKHAAETHQVSEVTKSEPAVPCTEPERSEQTPIKFEHENTHMSQPPCTHKMPPHLVKGHRIHLNLPVKAIPTYLMNFFQLPDRARTEMMDPPDPRSSKHIRSLPAVSKFQSDTAMTSLSQRLKQIQVPTEPVKVDFSHLSLSDLEMTKIEFGQTHQGKTYNEMWLHHQDWVLWFAGRYEKSGKENHQKLLFYIQKMVERAELAGTNVPMTKGAPPKSSMTASKAKAMPKMTPQPQIEAPSVWDMTEEEFEIFAAEEAEMALSVAAPEGNNPDVSHLEHRMLQVETTLSQIITLLENVQPRAEQQ